VDYKIYPLGDQAILIQFPQQIDESIHLHIQTITKKLEHQSFEWIIDIIPAFASIAIHYDIRKLLSYKSPFSYVSEVVEKVINENGTSYESEPREVSIPVFYGGEKGPDLEDVAKRNKLTIKEVIEIHSQALYTVYMIGFAPGFPFMGGLNEKIATPRKSEPRRSIPVGSVGIAGEQTGIYPIQTPGGWQIIGQTPEPLFRPQNKIDPTLLRAGDKVKFYAISEAEFKEWKERNV